MGVLLLAIALFVCLLLVPLGLPGTWLMVALAIGYNYLGTSNKIGWLAIGAAFFLAVMAEVFEWTLSARYARKYGGSKRAGWGAFIGGWMGAFAGVPIPIIGSMIGAFAGAFAGALIAEYTRSEATTGTATRVATGALLGR